MTINEKRQTVVDKYKTILGRNNYSQAKRAYCYKKYSNGKYYSDCSSSIALTYKECGFPFKYNGSSNPNTVGMYLTNELVDVPVVIKNGIIQNPEVLCVGDMLLFAGKDSSRKYAGYVGHVEMVYKISGSSITICGHGSGTPRTTSLNSYCRSRYNSKTNTGLGHRGLIKVRRYFVDEVPENDIIPVPEETTNAKSVIVTGNTVNIRIGPSTNYAKLAEVAKYGEKYEVPDIDGWTLMHFDNAACWISSKYVDSKGICTGGTVNVRCGPGTEYESVGIVKKGTKINILKMNDWTPVIVDKAVRFISGKYLK